MIFVFEGKSYDQNDVNLFYDHSLSIHKTFNGAKEALELEKQHLIKRQYEIKEDKIVDEYNGISIQCTLLDSFSNVRILTVSQWSIMD